MAYTELLAVWTGVSGLPGYSKFRFDGLANGPAAQSAANNIRTLFDAIKGGLPTGVTIAVQAGFSTHSDDGTLLSEGTIATPPASVVGTGTGTYLAASGFMIMWNTAAINGGKKVRGRTYFVPVSTAATQSDGTIGDSLRTQIQTAAAAFVASSPNPAVNSRARPSNPGAIDMTAIMTSATVPDKQVVLRSRRD